MSILVIRATVPPTNKHHSFSDGSVAPDLARDGYISDANYVPATNSTDGLEGVDSEITMKGWHSGKLFGQARFRYRTHFKGIQSL